MIVTVMQVYVGSEEDANSDGGRIGQVELGGEASDTTRNGDKGIEMQKETHLAVCSGDLGHVHVACLKEQRSLTDKSSCY